MQPTPAAGAVAVIPARGGSKRIPRKNVKAFAGRPMIAYAIQAACQAGVFDRIVVSTDDEEIAAVAREWGAQVPFVRPAELADDHAPTRPVIAHALDSLAVADPTPVCCIYPGVPLLQADDIARARLLLSAHAAEFVFPVAAFPSPVQRALVREPDGRSRPMQPEHTQTRTQDLQPAFFDVGQFYWALASTWRSGLSIHGHARTMVVPEWRSVDIDTPDDWARAEMLYRAFASR
ncbi:MAG: pseudaminic acid cytidylyltransferase [Pseudomonadota bacterium]|jgi:pseudaminic acid cytidylyltransferase